MSKADIIASTAVDAEKVPTYRNIQAGSRPPFSSDTSTSGSQSATYKLQYRVYRWRWFMLLAVCLLNISNGIMWLSYAPVPSFAATYYGVSVDEIDYFSIIYFVVSLVMGFIAIVLLDKVGLKVSLYIGATLNLLGSGIRLLASIEPLVCSSVPGASFIVALVGQALTAVAQPFILYSPTTLAAVWFGPKERALCTNFASVANPIGLAIAQIASPYIVTTVDMIPTMLWIYTIPAGVTFILTLVAFWWKVPAVPPAPTGDREHIPPFFKSIVLVLKNWSFWVLLIFWGGAAGLFNALLTLLPQILCPYGYSDRESGLWGALMIFFGLGGATVAGLIIDYTKMYRDVSVVSIALALLSYVWFMEVSTLVNQPVLIAASLCVFGFFGLAQIPVCMELGVEITYPVAESISSGLLWSAAQVLGILIVFISQSLEMPMNSYLLSINQCGSDFDPSANSSLPSCHPHIKNASVPDTIGGAQPLVELGYAMIFCPALITILFVFYVACFWPKYKRVDAERRASLEESIIVDTNRFIKN